MTKDLKDIGEEYRKASQDSFAQVARSVGKIQRGFQGIAVEMTEQSKRSVGQALGLQTRIVKKAYDAYVFEVTKLGQLMFSGYQSFLTRAEGQLPNVAHASRSGAQRTAAHRMTSSRKTGAARRRNASKRRNGRKK